MFVMIKLYLNYHKLKHLLLLPFTDNYYYYNFFVIYWTAICVNYIILTLMLAYLHIFTC